MNARMFSFSLLLQLNVNWPRSCKDGFVDDYLDSLVHFHNTVTMQDTLAVQMSKVKIYLYIKI